MSIRILVVLLLVEIFLCEPSNAIRRRRLIRKLLYEEEYRYLAKMREHNRKVMNIIYDRELVCREPEFFGWSSSECYGSKSSGKYIKYARDISCGKWRTIQDLAHSCKFNSDCDAFTVKDGTPLCMKQFNDNTVAVLGHNYDVYYVRSDLRKPIRHSSLMDDILGILIWCATLGMIVFVMYVFGGFSDISYEDDSN